MQQIRRRSRKGSDVVQIRQWLRQGVTFHQAGDLRQAESCYQNVLRRAPENADANHLFGVLASQVGRSEVALRYLQKAIRIAVPTSDHQLHLGNVFQDLGRYDEAIACYAKAIQLQPGSAVIANNWGNALRAQGRFQDALAKYADALAWDPRNVDVNNNLATIYLDLGEFESAAERLTASLRENPKSAHAHQLLGILQSRAGDVDQAIVSYTNALAAAPNLAEVWRSLGNALHEQGNLGEAAAAFRQSVKQNPERTLWAFRADTLCPVIPESDDAISVYREQLEATVLNYDRIPFTLDVEELAASNCHPPFYLAYHGRNDLSLKTRFADLFAKRLPRLDPQPGSGRPHLGFVVSDRHEPIFLRFTSGLIRCLDATEFRLSVFCSFGGHALLKKSLPFDHIQIRPLPSGLPAASQAIRDARCDVLFHYEIGTDAMNYFLPMLAPAPVQCTSWGMPVTSGIEAVDYFLSSELLEPSCADTHYREQLIQLSTLPVVMQRTDCKTAGWSRQNFGIPNDDRVYLCPHSLFKLHPDFDAVLRDILRGDERGRVVMIEETSRGRTALLQQRLTKSLAEVGRRVHFVPKLSHAQFLDLIRASEVLLDPIHFGGGSVTYQALELGVPIVTLPGDFMRGRVTGACYKLMGMTSCIADSKQQYASLANQVATDADFRAEIHQQIVATNDVLFDQTAAKMELNECFARMVRR